MLGMEHMTATPQIESCVGPSQASENPPYELISLPFVRAYATQVRICSELAAQPQARFESLGLLLRSRSEELLEEHLHEAQKILEVAIAMQAALRATPEDLSNLSSEPQERYTIHWHPVYHRRY
jgi:hypothetical protein